MALARFGGLALEDAGVMRVRFAFARLGGRIAIVSHAVEHLAAEPTL